MIATRQSDAKNWNPKVKMIRRKRGENNTAWLNRNLATHEDWKDVVLLVGGTDLTSFRLRVAQSHARRDLLPSFWSHAVLMRRAGRRNRWRLEEVSLSPPKGFGAAAEKNGVQRGDLSAYDDASAFPNMACLRFALGDADLSAAIEHVRSERSMVDIPGLTVEWLAYAWGVGDRGNPLLKSVGIPAAAFVEAVFALAGLEVTPGLSSQSSCPEAIWQAARWWHRFYQTEAVAVQTPPEGFYVTDQPAAAVVE